MSTTDDTNAARRGSESNGLLGAFLPMADAPLDGTLVRLLVKFDHNAIEDTNEPTVTIGSHNVGEWSFVGWCWHTDEWARGSGDLLGWLPLWPNDVRMHDCA